jgi:hypothetical protein
MQPRPSPIKSTYKSTSANFNDFNLPVRPYFRSQNRTRVELLRDIHTEFDVLPFDRHLTIDVERVQHGTSSHPSLSHLTMAQGARYATFLVFDMESTVIFQNYGKRLKGDDDKFLRLFGVDSNTAALIWNMVESRGNILTEPGRAIKHLLWSLLFLKNYETQALACILCRCSEKTHRKWVWIYVNEMSNLDVVSSPYFTSFSLLH